MSRLFQLDPALKAQRRAVLSQHPTQIGVDYVDYQVDYRAEGPTHLLLLYFVANTPAQLNAANLQIWGMSPSGLVVQTQVRAGEPIRSTSLANVWEIPLLVATDSTTDNDLIYTLEVDGVDKLDPFFTQASFTLQANRLSKIDPRTPPLASTTPPPTPEIDYLARDYQGLRQLILNRLSVQMPRWQESHAADLGHTLVELLAYAADQLSYYQDAVATEAYLGTARRRISVKRHARLIDYTMHEGCNARVWVQIQVNEALRLPRGTRLLTRTGALRDAVLTEAEYAQALIDGATVFETMHATTLTPKQNGIRLYDWGLSGYTLPQGAINAALVGDVTLLQPGQVVILEAEAADANPAHRHAVRLTAVQIGPSDALYNNAPITQITWHATDALPFPLAAATGVVLGNLVLADHGRTIEQDDLQPPITPAIGRYRPQVRRTDLTYCVPYDAFSDRDPKLPATPMLTQDPRQAVAAIQLIDEQLIDDQSTDNPSRASWQVRTDLLDSDRFTAAFVVEVENDGRAQLRFGDGVHGRLPAAGSHLRATYRVGKGHDGNVGQQAIAHLFAPEALVSSVTVVRNPLAAQGGLDPEPLEQVRLYAPQAFHTQQRCVVPADFAAVAERHPEVQKAVVNLQWSGSWYTAVVVVDRLGGRAVDAAFEAELLAQFEPYRIAGDDIAIRSPIFVALDIALTIDVARTHFASTVQQALLAAFSAVDLPSGRGFFHPDNFTIGQPVYLSQIITHATQIPGVAQVTPTRFQRLGRELQTALADGRIVMGSMEIALLDNQPDAPERGRIELVMRGGR